MAGFEVSILWPVLGVHRGLYEVVDDVLLVAINPSREKHQHQP